MARGRKPLTELTDLPLVETELEEGQIPFFLIDEEYGVNCDQYCYMLVKKKRATRTIKDEDGKPHHVESYWSWISLKYANTFQYIIECYVSIKGKDLNKKLVKSTDYKDLIKTQEQIRDILNNMFSLNYNKDFLTVGDKVDTLNGLSKDLKELENTRDMLKKECDDLLAFIKETRKIVMDKKGK